MDQMIEHLEVTYPWARRVARLRLLRLLRDPFLVAALLFILVLVLFAAFPAVFMTHDPNAIDSNALLLGPSAAHFFGTDEFGRDIWSRIVEGSRIELIVALASVTAAASIGIPLGLIAGFFGRWVDTLIMRVMDAVLAFPALLLAVLVVAAFGPSTATISSVVAFVYIPRFARIVRGSTLAIKPTDYVLSARAVGASDARIIFRTVLPNALGPLFVQASVALATAILIEAGLSFLGLGVQPPQATWGTMLQRAKDYLDRAPWYALTPGLFIFFTVLIFNFIGDRVRDHMDPRLRGLR